MIIDTHTHAYPDSLAPRALAAVRRNRDPLPPPRDGTVASLLDSMDASGIAASVVVSIATRPAQTAAILEWSEAIASSRLIPFPSVHPEAEDAVAWVDRIAEAGFKGIKLHPYYQAFDLAGNGVLAVARRMAEHGLVLLIHAGYDIAFPRERRCDPQRVAELLDAVPSLTLIAAHLGGWSAWDEVREYLVGRPVYLDTAYTYDHLGEEGLVEILRAHPPEYSLFGTDMPWADQGEALRQIQQLPLSAEHLTALLGGNAAALLDLPGSL